MDARCYDNLTGFRLDPLDPGTNSTVYLPVMDVKSENGLRSGAVARLAGISTDTLRHYERKGLLTVARQDNGYRCYSREAIDRIRMIRGALSVGFTIDELARIFGTRKEGVARCLMVRALAADKLRDIEGRLTELERFRSTLKRLLSDWDSRLAKTSHGQPARLLETLRDLAPLPHFQKERIRR